jgi:catechol 2,3-dioxygenase-like lactoylglutathione lyase family enzyme
MLIKESNVTINVKDLDKSVSFYQSIGFTIKNRWGEHYAQLVAPGIVIGLHPSQELSQTKSPGHISIGFTTNNFDNAKVLLNKLAIEFTKRDEEGGQFIHFSDPDGTPLYFIKPKW